MSITTTKRTKRGTKNRPYSYRHAWKEQIVSESEEQRMARLEQITVEDLRARDTIFCPCCKRNSKIVLNRDKNSPQMLFSRLFDNYKCLGCEKAFRVAGLGLIVPGSLLFGIAILMVGQFVRAAFG